jgi:hypothetical protein
MVKKICLIASLTVLLCNPIGSSGADFTVLDQFTEAFDSGLFQGIQAGSELSLESYGDSSGTQGLNVIATPSYSGKAVQVAVLEQNLLLTLSEGDNVVQGVNVYRGSADSILQMTLVSGSVTMNSRSNIGSIQGINVITSCDSCN